MKKCTFCGKESSDEMEVCPYDEQPLIPLPRARTPSAEVPRRSPAVAPQPPPQKSNHMPGLAAIAFIAAVLVVLLIAAGLLLPAWARAKQRTNEIKCASNLRVIGHAVRVYSADNKGILSATLLEMKSELGHPDVLGCPSSPKFRHQSGWDGPYTWSETNISYEYLVPRRVYNDVTNQVVVHCPIHGFDLMGDGTVRMNSSDKK